MKSSVLTDLAFFRPILRRWIALNKKLARRWADEPDVPWWYNERASVGLFAAAAWLEKGHAFEEFSWVKKKNGKDCSGRYDLEFSIGKRDFRAEVKQCWLQCGRGSDFGRCVSKSMNRAIGDVEKCDASGMQKLAMVFGVPSVSAPDKKAELSAYVREFISQAKSVKADATAWVFPDMKKPPIDKKEKRAYPGVILWIAKV